jgi:phosphatidylglycerophosphate synthase
MLHLYMSQKISADNENIFDNVFIYIGEYFVDDFHDAGYTPNMITTLSLVTGLLTALLLSYSNYISASVMFLISYIFDCMDGTMARKFNMVSVFGDYYDHISDISKLLIIFIVLYNNDSQKFLILLPFIIVFSILLLTHMGCQEQVHNEDTSPSLSVTRHLCTVEQNIQYTKWFGCGTFVVLMVIVFLIYKFT